MNIDGRADCSPEMWLKMAEVEWLKTYPNAIDGVFQDEHYIMIQKNVDVGKDLGRNFIYLTNITMENKNKVL